MDQEKEKMTGRFIREPNKGHTCDVPPIKWGTRRINGFREHYIVPERGTIWECECGRQYKPGLGRGRYGQLIPMWKHIWFRRKS